MMSSFPAWVLEPDDGDLLAYFGSRTMQRGADYMSAGRLVNVRTTPKLLTAQVRGSGFHVYQTSVVCESSFEKLITICTCPVHNRCKHAAALLLHARAAGAAAAAPDWRRALDPLLASVHDEDEGAQLALEIDDTGYGPTLRPLKRGRHGKWVKTGATWDDLASRARDVNQAQRQILASLLDTRRHSHGSFRVDALPLNETRPDAWELLRRAVDRGVELLPGTGINRAALPQPMLLEEPLVPEMMVLGSDGDLRLAPAVQLARGRHPLTRKELIGQPAHGVMVHAGDRLLLAPLTRQLDSEEHRLFSGGTLTVPGEDIGLFATGFLPQLRERVKVFVGPDVDLPEPQPPVLRCLIETGDARLGIRWGFRYRVGDGVHDVRPLPSPADPPLRQPAAEAALVASVPAGAWRDRDERERPRLRDADLTGFAMVTFATEVLPALHERDDVEVELTGVIPQFQEAEHAPQIALRIEESEHGDWFDLDVQVTIGDETVPFGPLFAALAMGQGHLILDSGTWFSLDVPQLDQLRAIIEEARLLVDHDGDTFHLRPEHAGLWEELVELGVVAEQSRAWREAVGALLNHDELAQVEPPAGLRADLRPYQRDGYAWLRFLWQSRLGGILADEMGLGKTVQSLAMAQAALEDGRLDRPMLVVAPTSVLGTWASEAARFAPELRVVAITETQRRRGLPLEEAIAGAHIVLTSYTLLRLEAPEYREIVWSAVLLDEAQFVKNQASKVYQAVRRLKARVKVALTGTPLENNLMDLWSLLSIAAPGLFHDPRAFAEAYRKPIEAGDSEALARLHRRIKPLILRRTKASVATELPDKQEQVIAVPLEPAHRKLYDRHLARERQKVMGLVGDLHRNRITILRSLTMLRQLSLSPSLVDPDYPAVSSKIDALLEHLDEVVSAGHRALVFSQFTGFLALVKKRLDEEGIGYEYLDGRTRDRATRIDAFREGDAPVFLISLKAGGFGLTLTEADYVFILDPWWNPATESQAIDRTHRIGQDKPVNVYRLVSADTIEEKVVALQERKRDLFDAVVGRTTDIASPLTADDIRGLLDA
ncbi:DEAD/DEAH box helicase [Tessaracoccus caeni]|uniref:DEAD/DEAH box helicase n=1 Tax=Tessaracoccus caeni TaxID=3031239 RepID=UPI0023DA6FF2|nr:DEAD/DEAH box helicase [Tessaracoccus caeni]MDF1487417.1 DEAD/DEAH box helicase [Tessaracoccus caeni]